MIKTAFITEMMEQNIMQQWTQKQNLIRTNIGLKDNPIIRK
jgi:hypothetical protein